MFTRDIRKKSYAMREVRPWHREAVADPCLKVFKDSWERAWNNVGQQKVSLHMAKIVME